MTARPLTGHGDPLPFDLLAPLPSGTTLLEASAGTGKTFTIAALATRYVAEGRATVDQLLMVTFGRSATRELRERVREALTRTRDALRDPGVARSSSDPVIASLAGLPEAECGAALDRLTRATADFDAATIATTHQFCLSALAGLGVNADKDPGETFVEDISDLIDEVVDDLYVRKYARAHSVRMTLADARTIARGVVGEPQSTLVAGPVTPDSLEETRVGFARAVAREVGARRRRRRLVTFDDLVLRLEAALTDPVTGDRACQRLRERYRVVLVDEFQDTDPAQWTILRRAFHGHRTLILIGDPKQAIYAFRGADVFSYLEASGHADQHATLPTNHRSDEAVVRGLADLMGGLELGDARIVVNPVTAANARPRLVGLATDARVRLRTWHPEDGELRVVGEPRAAIAADVAVDIVTTLAGPARLTTGDPAGHRVHPHEDAERPVAPGDIAVLVSTHNQAAAVRDALVEAGVPVVVASASSVFTTPAAEQWLTLMAAMEQPRSAAIRAAALTDFLGHAAGELATAGEHLDATVGLRLHTWAQVLDQSGVAALMAAMSQETDLAARVLGRPGGERHFTDLRHVASVLHREQRSRRSGLVALTEWLTDRMRRAGERDREGTTDLTRRLETDAAAVQVLTVHASKGLEFPIAYVPYGWDRFDRTPEILSCHDASGRRVLDVRGSRATGRTELEAAQRREEDGESLRLLYVALTRASSQVVVHWASSKASTRTAPLHRVLCARAAGEPVAAAAYPVAGPPIGAVAQSTWVVVEQVDQSPTRSRWTSPSGERPTLYAAPFARTVDTTWRRTSYTGLTAAAHGPERAPAGFRDDEPEGAAAAPDPHGASADARAPQPGAAGVSESGRAGFPEDHSDGTSVGANVPGHAHGSAPPDSRERRSAFADLPAGAAFGTLVHGILETIDTASADLPAEVRARAADALSVHPMRGVELATLAGAVEPALRTPLGPLAGGLSLAEIPPGDRLAELDFELPMGGSTAATLAEMAALLRAHVAADDPLARYPDHLAVPGLGASTLRGYLSGSIDAVLRLPGPQGHQFLVVDYKTNLLRDPRAPGVEQLAWGYRPDVLPAAMISAHYPLQALLYSAALHRYLRWRLPGYDPERHLGGVLYLFLRGMTGPGTPTQEGIACGVFSWRPPPPLVIALSDLLDGRWGE